jgi:ankyrin repeat protein
VHRTLEVIKLLLQYGAKVDAKSTCDIGMTPFHSSLVDTYIVMNLLFKHVKDINVCDNEGHTPLDWAITDHNRSAVELLVSHPSIDLTKKDRDGYTPWNLATKLLNDDDSNCDDSEECDAKMIHDIESWTSEDWRRMNGCIIVDLITDAMARIKRNQFYSYLISSTKKSAELAHGQKRKNIRMDLQFLTSHKKKNSDTRISLR